MQDGAWLLIGCFLGAGFGCAVWNETAISVVLVVVLDMVSKLTLMLMIMND
jgi:hypothetical protein